MSQLQTHRGLAAPLMFVVLGALGYGFSFGLYPEFRHDTRFEMEPFYCVVIWSGFALLPTAFHLYMLLDPAASFLYKVLGKLAYLGLLAGWIWNWIVIAEDTTWSILHSEYLGIYAIIVAYQVLFSLFAFSVGIVLLMAFFQTRRGPLVTNVEQGVMSL